MKTTLSGCSQLVVSLGIMSVLLMLIGSSMAASTQTSTGQADGRSSIPSKRVMASFTLSNVIQLSRLVGDTQADFAKVRLGDENYLDYNHRIAGRPRPPWIGLDKMSEQAFLDKMSKELYVFKKFIDELITLESQKKNSQFVTKLWKIKGQINRVLGYVIQAQIYLNYPITRDTSSPLPTRRPFATPKKQDEWELGVLKGFVWWTIPYQGEFYRRYRLG